VFEPFDPINLGINPPVEGGTPPYTYAWSCDYYLGNGAVHLTASDFLDDSTAANPSVIHSPAGATGSNYLTFYLTITDNDGITCADSVNIWFSEFFFFVSDGGSYFIEEGDSTQIGYTLEGGVQPFHQTWSPSEGLSDVHAAAPWAKPDTTTFYFVTVVDSVGCEFSSPTSEKVYVSPVTGIGNPLFDDSHLLQINPNPATSIIRVAFASKRGKVLLMNAIGDVIVPVIVAESQIEMQIDVGGVPNGVYLLLHENGISKEHARIIVHH